MPRIVFPRPLAHPLRVEISEHVQLRIQPLDLANVGLGQFGNGDCTGAQKLQLLRGRFENNVVHR